MISKTARPSFDCPEYVVDQVMRKRGRIRVFERFTAGETALLVIDMQRYYVEQMAAAKAIVPNINAIADRVRTLGGTVAWVSMVTGDDGQSLWPLYHDFFHTAEKGDAHRDGLTPASSGFALWPDLDVRDGDLQTTKTRFSPFISGASDLPDKLRAANMKNVIICGVATNFCSETTARDAMMLDYRVVMASDGNAARYPEDHLAGLTSVFQSFGDVLTTEEILQDLLVETPLRAPSRGNEPGAGSETAGG